MDGNRECAVRTLLVGIAYQLDEHKGQKQGRKEVKRTVLVAGDAVIGAGLFARKFQINFIMAGDLLNLPVLKDLKTGAEANDYATTHILSGLLEDAVGCLGRMLHWQDIENSVKFLFGAHGK